MSAFGFGFYDFYDSDNSSDSNGSFGSAQFIGSLRSDLNVSGSVGGYSYYGLGLGYYSDYNDYFEFELPNSRNVAIKSDENDVTVRLYDDQRRYIGRLDDADYGGSYAREDGYEEGLAVSLSRGNYYLRVSGGSDFTSYEIDFDADSDDDYSLDDARQLGTLDCSKRIGAQVGELDFGDSYRFRPGRSGAFTVRQTDNLGSRRPELRLYDDDQDLIATSRGQIRRSLDRERDYYLRVAAEDPQVSQYQVTLTPNPIYQGTSRADQLRGCADDEILRGLAGDDQLIGSKGDDQLVGGADDDRLQGDAGNERLAGGSGFDLLVGGSGRDIFDLSGSSDRIRDFQNGIDRLELPDQISFSDLSIVQQGQNLAIRFGSSNLAILTKTQITQIDASDFV